MEHSQIITLVAVTFREIIDDPTTRAFGKEDIASRVLAAHPKLDRKRLDRCIDSVWKQMNPFYFGETEYEAELQQQIRHAETLPHPENFECVQKWINDWRDSAIRRMASAYLWMIGLRILGAHMIKGADTKFDEMIDHLGVDGFAAAAWAELQKDGHGLCVTITGELIGLDNNHPEMTVTYPAKEVLDYFRRQAEQCESRRVERAP